jgi:very-short-patch-repair endonuclease
VEVDGLWHQRRVALAERRDRVLSGMGYLIVHLDASLVMQRPLVAVLRTRKAIPAEH